MSGNPSRTASLRVRLLLKLVALEHHSPRLAHLVAGCLTPLGLLPALPSGAPTSWRHLALGAVVLLGFLWFGAGPVLSAAQPVLATAGSVPGGVWLGATLGVLVGWRMQAGRQYLDAVRLLGLLEPARSARA